MTLQELKNKVNERIDIVYEQALESPSIKWFERMETLLNNGKFTPYNLAVSFIRYYKKEIFGFTNGNLDKDRLLEIFNCSKEDVTALGKELLSSDDSNEEIVIDFIDKESIQKYFNSYIKQGQYGDMLSDIIYFLGYNTSEILPMSNTLMIERVNSLIESNLSKVYNSYNKMKEEIERKEAEEIDEDYDEGFDDIEESVKRHKKRLRF